MDVQLRPLTADEFPAWRTHALESFAADLTRALDWPIDAARDRAAAVFDEALPGGLDTDRSWLLVIESDGQRVGAVWIGPHPQRADAAFAYDIEIDEAHRGRGYGRAAIAAAEALLAAAGVRELGLSVFGFNGGARRLYESLGYRTLSVQMSKPLG